MIEIRYTPNELGESGVVEHIAGVDDVRELADGSVLLYSTDEDGSAVKVGKIAAGRWDRYHLIAEENAE